MIARLAAALLAAVICLLLADLVPGRPRSLPAWLRLDPRWSTALPAAVLGTVLLSPPAGVVMAAIAIWTLPRLRRRQWSRGLGGSDTLGWLQALDRAMAQASSPPEAWRWAAQEAAFETIAPSLRLALQRYHVEGESWPACLRSAAAGCAEPAAASLMLTLALCSEGDAGMRSTRLAISEVAPSLQSSIEARAELRAATAAQRAQGLVLALLVPVMALALLVLDSDYRHVLLATDAGRWILLPAAIGLEFAGVVWSLRLAERMS